MNHIDYYIRKNMMDEIFTQEDEVILREYITAPHRNPTDIVPYLNIYWQNFEFQEDIVKICGRFICDDRTPSLTATCMRCLNDSWGVADRFSACIRDFLHINKFDYSLWSEEIYKAFCIVVENKFFTNDDISLLEAVALLLNDAGISYIPEIKNFDI
jgi:hypothetical protein